MKKILIISMLASFFTVPGYTMGLTGPTPQTPDASELLSQRLEQAVNDGYSTDSTAIYAYLHVFVSADGTLSLVELYCPSALMKRHIIQCLGGGQRIFTHDLPSGHYEFKLKLAVV